MNTLSRHTQNLCTLAALVSLTLMFTVVLGEPQTRPNQPFRRPTTRKPAGNPNCRDGGGNNCNVCSAIQQVLAPKFDQFTNAISQLGQTSLSSSDVRNQLSMDLAKVKADCGKDLASAETRIQANISSLDNKLSSGLQQALQAASDAASLANNSVTGAGAALMNDPLVAPIAQAMKAVVTSMTSDDYKKLLENIDMSFRMFLIEQAPKAQGYKVFEGTRRYYKLYNSTPASYSDAKATCARDGGRLARTYGDQWKTSLRDSLSTLGFYSQQVLVAGKRVGTGGSNVTSFDFGDGVVLDAQRPSTSGNFTQHWGYGAPSATPAVDQDCILYTIMYGSSVSWADVSCTDPRPSVCELTPLPTLLP